MRIIKGESRTVSPGKLYGYTQVKLGAQGIAYSPNQSFRWESGENTSSCPSPAAAHHHNPALCSHGIKASFIKGEAPVFSRFSMTAVVEGYGEAVTDGKGFRAQRGRLRAIALNEPMSRIKPQGKAVFVLLSLLSLLGIALMAGASHIFTVAPVFSLGNTVFGIVAVGVSVMVLYNAFVKGLLPLAREYVYERSLTKRVGQDETARNQEALEDFKKCYPEVEIFNSAEELLGAYGDKLRATDVVTTR